MQVVLDSVYVLYGCILHEAGKEMELAVLLLAMTALNLIFHSVAIEERMNPSSPCRLRCVLINTKAK